jgi:hypothetical protein
LSVEGAARRRALSPRDLRINSAVFEGALPVLVFWLLNQAADPRIAIAGSFATAVVVFMRNRDSGVIRFLSTVGFAVVAASAVVGLIFESDKAFAAQNIVSDFLTVPLGIGTIVVGRPLVGMITRELVPAIRPYMAVTHSTFVWLTLISVAINASTGVMRWYMLDALSTNDYVILSRILGIPFNILYFGGAFLWIRHDMEKALDDVPPPAGAVPLPAGDG